jgi:hypothetical protein
MKPFSKDYETAVLGSIPIGDLQAVLDRLFSYAIRAVYIGEVLNDAPRKRLHHALASAGKMPHAWSREQWAEQVSMATARHPRVAAYLRTKDKRAGSTKARVMDTFNVSGQT